MEAVAFGQTFRQVLTGPGGYFEIQGVPTDSPFTLTAMHPDWEAVDSPSLTLRPGEVRNYIELVLKRAP